MKTQAIDVQSFTGVKFPANAPKELTQKLLNTKAIKAFGRRYNAEASVGFYSSESKPEKVYYGILLEEIKPTNIFTAITNFIKNRHSKHMTYIHYNSGKTTEKEFLEEISKLDKKSLVNLFRGRNH